MFLVKLQLIPCGNMPDLFQKLNTTEKTIIQEISKFGSEITPYSIHKKTGISYPTVFVNAKNLEEKGLLISSLADEKKKQKKKNYTLTFCGVCCAVALNKGNHLGVEEIIKKWSLIHPFFKAWSDACEKIRSSHPQRDADFMVNFLLEQLFEIGCYLYITRDDYSLEELIGNAIIEDIFFKPDSADTVLPLINKAMETIQGEYRSYPVLSSATENVATKKLSYLTSEILDLLDLLSENSKESWLKFIIEQIYPNTDKNEPIEIPLTLSSQIADLSKNFTFK